MSASIRWEPVDTRRKFLNVSIKSHFIDQAEKIFGKFPIELSHQDLVRVDTLAQLNSDWMDVKTKLVENGKIILTVEY